MEPCAPQSNHSHVFDQGNQAAERGTRRVVALTAVMMVVEIICGSLFNSMALLADGWHMSSHVLAIGLSTLAYVAARRLAHDDRYAFGTWKIEVLAGFASAIVLLGIAAGMAWESVDRLINPEPIAYREAIAIAGLGLIVNLVSAWLLGHAAHGHGHATHAADHAHRHDDLNLRSAYLHVLADAATSVLAILALVLGLLGGWSWVDAMAGIVGAAVVAVWSVGLIQQTARVLLDREMDQPVVTAVRQTLAQAQAWGHHTELTDLHLWRVGRARWACIIGLATTVADLNASQVRQALAHHDELAHITVEIHHLTRPD